MLQLLFSHQYALFLIIIFGLIISLTFHEFGHAVTAYYFGDDTAARMGRLSLNPLVHLDFMGLIMVIIIGFGYAKPVPTDPRKFNSRWAELVVSAAGPGMNLILAILAINLYGLGLELNIALFAQPETGLFFQYLALINLVLMIFNLIPFGPLDGHYILPYFLPQAAARRYLDLNARYGNMILMGLIVLSLLGIPIFQMVFSVGHKLLPLISFI